MLDVALNSFCLLFAITTYSSHSILLNILILTPALFFYFQPPYAPTAHEKNLASLEKEKFPEKQRKVESLSSHKPFVTAYRGGMMVITCLAILAVDFKVFPRRFAKAETLGTSLVSTPALCC
jgi:phosphatidylinositol glycan class W